MVLGAIISVRCDIDSIVINKDIGVNISSYNEIALEVYRQLYRSDLIFVKKLRDGSF